MIIPPVAIAVQPLPVKVIDLDLLIKESAEDQGISYDKFYKTLSCESDGFKDVAIQSQVVDKNGPGGHENSWGISQLDLDYHPDITKAEAIDPEFAIPYAAKMFRARPGAFYCYTKLFK